MPPKKAATKNTTAKAGATVSNKKGKEFETTAAVERPRRGAATATTSATPAKAKATPAKKTAPKAPAATTTSTGKKRGRPAKTAPAEEEEEDDAPPPKKRGRPSTASAEAPAVAIAEKAPPKKRGRPPKGGETTKIDADEEAAAEQLEEELVDDADSKTNTSPTKKRGRPANSKKAVATTAATSSTDAADEVVDEDAREGDVEQYWLMKAEQEDREETLKDGTIYNAKFTIDDLRDKAGPEPWDGVRNPTACKNMKEMKLGDLAFFYASGGKKGRQPGIVGIMEVVKEAVPDMSAFDPNAAYYVQNAKNRGTEDNPRWYMVHVEFRKKLAQPVTLKELQKFAQPGGKLADMQEFRAARLSVSKVAKEEWDFICNELIDGYEDDGAENANGDVEMAEDDGGALPNGNATPDIKETIESEPPTTDTALPSNTAATSSRPASRAGSRAPSAKPASRAGSRAPSEKKAGSRAGSLAPPRASSRGRSRTPGGGRAASAQPAAPEMEAIQE